MRAAAVEFLTLKNMLFIMLDGVDGCVDVVKDSTIEVGSRLSIVGSNGLNGTMPGTKGVRARNALTHLGPEKLRQ